MMRRFRSYALTASLLLTIGHGMGVARPARTTTDLSVEQVTVSPVVPKVGEQATIHATIKNVGDTTVTLSPCPAQIYVDGILLKYACVQIAVDLAPGQSMVQDAPWLPDHPGQVSITARIQYPGDSNNQNNARRISVAVTQPDPVTDIAISGISLVPDGMGGPFPLPLGAPPKTTPTVDGKAVAGQATLVQVIIVNNGNQRVQLTQPADVTVTIEGASLTRIDTYPLDLQPGSLGVASFRWTPDTAKPMTLTAHVKTLDDGTYQPPETNIADNTFTTTINVEAPLHDLAVNSIAVTSWRPLPMEANDPNKNNQQGAAPSSPGSPAPVPVPGRAPAAGEPAWIVVDVANNGNVWERVVNIQVSVNGESLTPTTSRIRCAGGGSPASTANDTGGCVIPERLGLPPGATQSFFFNWTPPKIGAYNISATVTPVEGETNTANNTGSAVINIKEARFHDMSLDAMTVANPELWPGSVLVLNLSATNRGTVTETGVFLNLYVNSHYFFGRSIGTFRAGETKSGPLRISISRRTVPGTYNVMATISPVFAETDTANNTQQTQVVVKPPLKQTPGAPPSR